MLARLPIHGSSNLTAAYTSFSALCYIYLEVLVKTFRLLLFLAAACAIAFAGDQYPNAALLTSNPIYKKNCAACHGKSAVGRHFNHAPSLLSEKTAAASPDDLRTIILKGKGEMPKFSGKISAAELDALIQQIKTANQK